MIIPIVIASIFFLRCVPSNSFSLKQRQTDRTRRYSTKENTSYYDDHHPIGLYIHIPYCRRRCRYCNFSIIPIGTKVVTEANDESNHNFHDIATRGFLEMDKNYLHAILTELKQVKVPKDGSKIKLTSIYFGGGTPSLAPVETIAKILDQAIGNHDSPFILADQAEITIEMDPGTFSIDKLKALKSKGINRISLGVQSFHDSLLENMGRVHRRSDVYQAIQFIHDVYGSKANFSIDLITGLPGLTPAKWIETLQEATSLIPKPSHMSIYDLQIEQGTVFSSWYDDEDTKKTIKTIPNKTLLRLPTDDECAFMYKYTAGYLRSKDYEHYEVSSYAYRGGQNTTVSSRSRHNQIYWAPSSSWYAIGLGATSFVERRLVARPKTLADYYTWLEDNVKEAHGIDKLSKEELLTEMVMKRLRTSDGLDLKLIQRDFGDEVVTSILKGANLGLELGMAECTDEVLKLKDPDGLLYSNYLISSIFAELE